MMALPFPARFHPKRRRFPSGAQQYFVSLLISLRCAKILDFFLQQDKTPLLTHPIHPVVPASAAPECLLYCRNTTAQGVRISDAVPLPCSRSILHLKRRAFLWPPASAVIHASGGNIRVPQPLLYL